MIGRGLLGKWGPNHAADPIVTRWKRERDGKKVMANGKPCLEFVAIKRKDTGEWALPGVRVEYFLLWWCGHVCPGLSGDGGSRGHCFCNTQEGVW